MPAPSKRNATLWLFAVIVSLGLVIGAGAGLFAAQHPASSEAAAAPDVKAAEARPSPSELQGLVQRALQRLPRPGRPPAS